VPEQHRNLINRRAGDELGDGEGVTESVRVTADNPGKPEQFGKFVFPVSDCGFERAICRPKAWVPLFAVRRKRRPSLTRLAGSVTASPIRRPL
jgi:hypothetical protein